MFKKYAIGANELGKEITAQGLLRLERLLNHRRQNVREIVERHARPKAADSSCTLDGKKVRKAPSEENICCIESMCELICELKNHNNFLAEILKPLCSGNASELNLPEKRLTLRLLQDVQQLLVDFEHILFKSESSNQSVQYSL
jgi:hypothetical protein